MNSKTARFFETLNAEVKDRFGGKMIKTEKDQLIAIVETLLKSSEVDNAKKRKLRFLLDNKLLGKENHETVDDKITTEIKKFYDTKIENAIRSGEIPPPDIDEYNAVSRKFNRNL